MPPAPAKTQALTDHAELAELTAKLLSAPHNPIPFSVDEARLVLPYLRLVHAPTGAPLLLEGDQLHTAHLLLVLDGNVQVDIGGGADHVALAVVGPGQMLGEMALLDGGPRSASCTAVSPVRAAALSRVGLQRLLDEQPAVAARLLATIAQRVGERLRGLSDQLALYAQLVDEQRGTIDRLQGRG